MESRMKLRHAGEIMELLKEAETIQKDLRVSNTPPTIAEISKKFTREMRKDNINSAMKLFSRQHTKWYSSIKCSNLVSDEAKTPTW